MMWDEGWDDYDKFPGLICCHNLTISQSVRQRTLLVCQVEADQPDPSALDF